MNLKSVPDLEQPVRTDAFVETVQSAVESAGICDEPEECTGLEQPVRTDAFVATGTECAVNQPGSVMNLKSVPELEQPVRTDAFVGRQSAVNQPGSVMNLKSVPDLEQPVRTMRS